MDWPALPFIVLRLALLLAGLLLPGTMLLRALRLPWSLAAAFVASSATLYVVILVFACTGINISLLTLATALGLVALAGRLVSKRGSATELASSFSCFSKMGWWLPLYLAFWAIVGYRLVAQPLSGPDVYFRWSWLAEQMLRFGTLDFYPPHNGGDFVRYYWAESIPPGIASLYAWACGCGGSRHALWTSPVIALQLLSLHEIIWRLASRWGGEIVARRAVLLAAACPLLTWSVLIGQETGLTALALCGLVWCLHHLREEDGIRWAALAGIFTIAAGSTREYGPVFAVAAIAATIFLRAPLRQTLVLAKVALPVALAWPLRVWVLTGNPFFSLNLGGLFPVNPVFTAWNDAFRGPHQFALGSLANWQALGRYWLLWALPAVAGLIALVVLLVQRLREAQVVAWFVALIFALWFASVAYTAGGLFYSLRVLSPAFALLVVAASYALGLLGRQPGVAKFAAVAVALVLLESLPKTLVLPENPYRVTARDWPQAGGQFIASVRTGEQELLAKLQPLPDRRRILSDDAGMPRVFAAIGTEVAPLWSPEVAWLFDGSLKSEVVARRWQISGFRYLVLGKSGPTAGFVRTHAQWRAPYFTVRTVAETETHLILEATVAVMPPR
jgi:hypothetical protein